MKNQLLSGLKNLSRLLPVVLLVFAGAGCTTYERYSPTYNLWQQPKQPSFCRPHADPELALFDLSPSHEVLVIYNCGSERHPGSHRRAYFLEASRTNIAAGKPPQFVDPKRARGLTPICVLKQYSSQAAPDPTNTWARVQTDSFTLYRPGRVPETCQLPVYQDYFPKSDTKQANWWRIALTPFAVTTDATVITAATAVVVGTITAPIWLAFVH